jgi:pseudaminic acid biosynthesis-associated methylase
MTVVKTEQIGIWEGQFGKEYTDRNTLTPLQLDQLYERNYGVSRAELNEEFVGSFDRSVKILEAGCSLGNQLLSLQQMGFKNLYGIEINRYAVQQSKTNTKDINIIYGSVFDIPFRDGFFNLVFTSGVLIHIAPQDVKRAIKEIYRSSGEYIWGFEYYADTYTEVQYRGHSKLLWKADFVRLYLEQFEDLELIKEKRLKYSDNNNIDTMYLLRKSRRSE